MFTSALKEEIGENLSKDAEFVITAISSGATRMRELIQDLLDLSRARNRELECRDTPLDIMIGNVLNDLSISIRESGAAIEFGSLPVVQCDPILLAQVFQNLISNAIKFRREEVAPRIHISVQTMMNEHEITVSDNGIGIASDDSEKVFAAFKRLHARIDYEGSGIGLSICRKIVNRHGGRIWIESNGSIGSHFHFTLPILERT